MSIPVYRRVAFDLQQKILSGYYAPGSLLPSESRLQELYQVSRTTVRRAIAQLNQGDYVTVRQGHGTEVTQKHRPIGFHRFHNITEVAEELLPGYETARPDTALFHVDECAVDTDTAKELDIQPGTRVYRLRRIFAIEGMPFVFMTNYVRTDVAPGLIRFNGQQFDLYSLLTREYGVVFQHGSERISACTADAQDAQLLHIAEGAALIRMARSAYHKSGPMEHVVTKIRPDVYALRIDMEGPPKYQR